MIDRLARLAAVLLWLSIMAERAAAQRIELTVGDPRAPQLAASGRTMIPVSVDLSAARGMNVAALQVRLSWNAEALRIDSVRSEPGSGFVLTQNVSAARDGRLVFNLFRPFGVSASGILVWLYGERPVGSGGAAVPHAKSPNASRVLALRVSVEALGDQDGRDLREWLQPVRVVVCDSAVGC